MAATNVKPCRVGVIGFGHMHINDVMRRFAEVGVDWVACADTAPDVAETSDATFTRAWNRRYAHETIGIPKVYDDYREMLEREQFDLVAVYCENALHAEVVDAVAAKGVNVLVEKPMADSLANALRMARAAEANGVKLIVNWPSTWTPTTQKVKALLESGVIGQPFEMKWRSGHAGPLASSAQHQGVVGDTAALTDADRGRSWWHRAGTGGGALLDFCSYGACLSRWYFGEPAVAAFGLAANLGSPFAAVEDNAIIGVRFPKALALLEASWTTRDHGVATGPIVYGERGTLVVDRRDSRPIVRIGYGAGREEIVEAEALPVGRQSIAQEIVHHLTTGEPLHPTLEPAFNLEAMAILDAGARSVRSGKLELVNDLRWCVG